MASTIGIDVAVDAKDFDALRKAFDAYSKALDKLPQQWKSVGNEVAKTRSKFEVSAAEVGAVAGSMAVISKHATDFYHVSDSTVSHWKNLSLHTASTAKSIVGMTEGLLKWSGIVGILTGGAGLFGFDRLAKSVSSQRMGAMSTGASYGDRAAFTANFANIGFEGFDARVAGFQSDVRESKYLSNLGLSPGVIKGSNIEATIKALEAGARIAAADKATGVAVGSDRKLEAFSVPERIRLRDHPEEIAERVRAMRADQKSGRFDVSAADQKAYQEFTTQMSKAGQEIETVFVKGLIKLAAPLEELSKSVVTLVDKFVTAALPRFMDDLAEVTDWAAKEIGRPSFIANVEAFIADVGSLASSLGSMLGGLARFARWLGVGTAAAATGGAPGTSGVPGTGTGAGTMGGAGTSPTGGGMGGSVTPDDVAGRTTTPAVPGRASSATPGALQTDERIAPFVTGSGDTRADKNLNPANIMWGPWAKAHGAIGSSGTDVGHGVAVFPTAEAGFAAMEDLAKSKYAKGFKSVDDIIAKSHWTYDPRNPQHAHDAARAIARHIDVDPNADVKMNSWDAARWKKFKEAVTQEEGAPKLLKGLRESKPVSSGPKQHVSINTAPGGNHALSIVGAGAIV